MISNTFFTHNPNWRFDSPLLAALANSLKAAFGGKPLSVASFVGATSPSGGGKGATSQRQSPVVQVPTPQAAASPTSKEQSFFILYCITLCCGRSSSGSHPPPPSARPKHPSSNFARGPFSLPFLLLYIIKRGNFPDWKIHSAVKWRGRRFCPKFSEANLVKRTKLYILWSIH